MSQSIEYMCRGLIDGYRDNDPNISDRLVDTQAKRAAELVRRLRRPGVMTLPDPVGTGKTVVALAVAAYLVGDKTVNRILVIAPNDVVARLWCGRAQRLVSHAHRSHRLS